MKTIDIAREIICPIMNEVIKEDFEKAMYTITCDGFGRKSGKKFGIMVSYYSER